MRQGDRESQQCQLPASCFARGRDRGAGGVMEVWAIVLMLRRGNQQQQEIELMAWFKSCSVLMLTGV